MSQSWPLTLLSSLTKTYTADAVIRAPQDWPMVLLLVDTKTNSYTANAVIEDFEWYTITAPNSLSYTANAIIVSGVAVQRTSSYTADATISPPTTTLTSSYTADAAIAAAAPAPGPGPPPDAATTARRRRARRHFRRGGEW